MAYEFKKLSEMELLDSVPAGAAVLAEVDGVIRRVPGDGLGGSGVSATPDWKQNDPTAADYIKGRLGGFEIPLPQEAKTYTWDGVITGKEKVVLMADEAREFGFCKISDDVLYTYQLVGASATAVLEDGGVQEQVLGFNGSLMCAAGMLSISELCIVAYDDIEFVDVTLTRGIWMYYGVVTGSEQSAMYISNLQTVALAEDSAYSTQPIPSSALSPFFSYDYRELYLTSSDSAKRFKITVDDTGTITAAEITT